MPPAPALSCRPLNDLAPRLLARDAAFREATLLRAEELHDSLEPDATYPVDYLAFRLSGLRRDHGDAALLLGSAVAADLRLLIDALSRGLTLPVSPPESRLAEDWAARLDVSTRTLARWRTEGLRWRWLTPGRGRVGRRQIGFTAAALEHHRRVRPGRVERATGFSHLAEADHGGALARAAELAGEGKSLSAAAARIAAELGRAHETLRQRLLRHDAGLVARGEPPLFPRSRERLDRVELRELRRAARRGEPVAATAKRMDLKPAAVRRVQQGHRAAVALRLPIRLPKPSTGRPPAEEAAPPRVAAPLPAGLPDGLAAALLVKPAASAEARSLAAAYRAARSGRSPPAPSSAPPLRRRRRPSTPSPPPSPRPPPRAACWSPPPCPTC